jgi:hypothetical protein
MAPVWAISVSRSGWWLLIRNCKPVETFEMLNEEGWGYSGITFDPVTGDRDFWTFLTIQGAIVTSVMFY